MYSVIIISYNSSIFNIIIENYNQLGLHPYWALFKLALLGVNRIRNTHTRIRYRCTHSSSQSFFLFSILARAFSAFSAALRSFSASLLASLHDSDFITPAWPEISSSWTVRQRERVHTQTRIIILQVEVTSIHKQQTNYSLTWNIADLFSGLCFVPPVNLFHRSPSRGVSVALM